MTRPISSRQLFADKLIVVFLVCVLMPVLTLQLLNVFGLISDSGAINDHAWITAPVAGLLAVILGFMLVASLTQNMRQYVFVMFGFMFVSFVTSFAFMQTTVIVRGPDGKQIIQPSHHSEPLHPDILKWTFIGLAIVGMFFIIYNQYTRRRRIITIIFSAILALVLYGIWRLWPMVPPAT